MPDQVTAEKVRDFFLSHSVFTVICAIRLTGRQLNMPHAATTEK